MHNIQDATTSNPKFLAVKSPAWHKLGLVIDEPIPATEALVQIKGDYQIHKLPKLTQLPDGSIYRLGDEKNLLMREPTADDPQWREFGHVGADYGLLQNRDLTELVDRTLGAVLPLETIGLLGHGETIFVCLAGGKDQVKGEEVRNYYLVTDTRTGTRGLQIAYTTVRTVCENTLISALGAASVKWMVSHTKDFAVEVEAQADIIHQIYAARDKTLDVYRAMADTKLTEAQVEKVLTAAYPEVKASGFIQHTRALTAEFGVTLTAPRQELLDRRVHDFELIRDRQVAQRENVKVLYERLGDQFPAIGGTGWALYNAVVENADYYTDASNGASVVSAIAESSLFGDRAKVKAAGFKALAALAGRN